MQSFDGNGENIDDLNLFEYDSDLNTVSVNVDAIIVEILSGETDCFSLLFKGTATLGD